MKHLAVVAGILGSTIMAGCVTRGPESPAADRIGIIGHRGASAKAPENTLAAFALAADHQADWFELDCTLSKDNEIIVIHDGEVDRTTNGKGVVAEMTLDELRKLDAGTWKAPKFAGEKLPTLEEALELAKKRRIGVYIEIKDSADDAALLEQILAATADVPSLDEAGRQQVLAMIAESGSRNYELTRRVVELVRKKRMADEVVIQSFAPICCATARLAAPELRVEFLTGVKPEDAAAWEHGLRYVYLFDLHGVNTAKDTLNPGRLALLHASGKTCAVWTVNDSETMERLARWGVNYIITDRPDLCFETLKKVGKR